MNYSGVNEMMKVRIMSGMVETSVLKRRIYSSEKMYNGGTTTIFTLFYVE